MSKYYLSDDYYSNSFKKLLDFLVIFVIPVDMNKNGNEITITEDESKICLLDNKKFESNRKMIWHVRKTFGLSFENYIIKTFYNGIKPVCLKTGKPVSFKANKLGPWFSNYSKNNFPRKPHTEKTKQKIKEGCEKNAIEKFGVKNVFSTNWCKEKIKKTMLEKYGTENIMKTLSMRHLFSNFKKSNEAIIKTKNTNLQKYGATVYTSTDECKLKVRKYNYKLHYNDWVKYIQQLDELRIKCLGSITDIENNVPLKFECCICGYKWEDTLLIPFCHECDKNFEKARSKEESSVMKWIKSILPNDSLIKPNKRFNFGGKTYESDIFLEKEKLVIELNGLFWHSEMGGKKDRYYHKDKLTFFESLGFSVIQIFEDEWLFKTNIVKDKILHKLGINKHTKLYARQCIIKQIDNTISNVFLENTHIQGKVNASLCYGAFYNDELVAVMTFSPNRVFISKKRGNNFNEYELVRFSTTNKYRIVGIAGKLLSYFVMEKLPSKIISYADRRWTSKISSNVYEKIGFKLISETNPNYWYVKKYKREHRFNFRKQKLIEMGGDPNKTEWEIMREAKYDRIWDCGHLKYEWVSNAVGSLHPQI